MDLQNWDLDAVRTQLGEAAEFVMTDLRQKWRELSGGPSIKEALLQFVHAVDWTVSLAHDGSGLA